MSPLEAKKIIESLANGIDPETGEILSDQDSVNNPQVIRALFVAIKALDRTAAFAEKAVSRPDNSGKSWSEDEDKRLIAAFDTGITTKEIAKKHGRSHGSITARLARHGRNTLI